MSSSVVKVNGVEVTSDASKPTVINININQPSSLYSLIESTRSAWKGRKTADGAKAVVAPKDGSSASVAPFRGEQKVLGAVQIMVGLMCFSIGVLFCFVNISYMFWTGTGFWTGIPFILAGVVSIVGEKRASCCWLSAELLMNSISLAVAIAGIVMISNDLRWFGWWNWDPDNLCNTKKDDYYGSYYYRTTTPEPRNWRMEECKDVFSRLLTLYIGIRAMLLVAISLALCISLYSLGFGWKTLCCALASEQEEEVRSVEDVKEPLLTSQPPPYAEKNPKVETV